MKQIERKTFYVCDLGTRGRLRQTKLSFGQKTTRKEKMTSDITTGAITGICMSRLELMWKGRNMFVNLNMIKHV